MNCILTYFLYSFERELKNKLSEKTRGAQSEEQVLMKAFKYFDLNDNGTVEPDEFAKAIEKIGIQIPTRQVSLFLHLKAQHFDLFDLSISRAFCANFESNKTARVKIRYRTVQLVIGLRVTWHLCLQNIYILNKLIKNCEINGAFQKQLSISCAISFLISN